MENLGNRSGITDVSITANTRDRRISDEEYNLEDINSTVKENSKLKILLHNIHEIQDKMKGTDLRIIGIERELWFSTQRTWSYLQQNHRSKAYPTKRNW